MKASRFFLIIWVSVAFICTYSAEQIPLSEFYKKGQVWFEQEYVLDDDTMPADLIFDSPSTVSCDPEGNIYVVDSRALNIKKFDARGKFLKTIGREGQGPGEFPDLKFVRTIYKRELWRKKYVRTQEYGISMPLVPKENLFRV